MAGDRIQDEAYFLTAFTKRVVGLIFAAALLVGVSAAGGNDDENSHDIRSQDNNSGEREVIARRSMQHLFSSEPVSIKPEDSIAASLLDAHDSGNTHPRFTLFATMSGEGAVGAQSATSEFLVHLREPVQAVTSTTIVSKFGGPSRRVGELDYTILVSDVEMEDASTIAIIAVNKKSGEVQGIVHKGEQKVKISQGIGEMVRQFVTVHSLVLWLSHC